MREKKNSQAAIQNYEDMMNLPHHVSKTHPQMSLHDRAAQFSPFAALTGYESAIKETQRLTDTKMELDENVKAELDEKIKLLQEYSGERPKIQITYFVPDERKAGGSYQSVMGIVKRIDGYERKVILQDGTEILVDDIAELSGELFRILEW